jgi:hypothetical protein
MTKLSNKQKKAIELIEEFIPKILRNPNRLTHYYCPELNIPIGGKSAVEAFFDYTDRGIFPKQVQDPIRFAQLLYGHRWMATHEKMYRECFLEGNLFLEDFKNESQIFKNFVGRIREKTFC